MGLPPSFRSLSLVKTSSGDVGPTVGVVASENGTSIQGGEEKNESFHFSNLSSPSEALDPSFVESTFQDVVSDNVGEFVNANQIFSDVASQNSGVLNG